ncbi:MAG: phage BR0599 family protein [Pseudogulbenkiania sp.]|nr:phage BR0599 family protein [Pseudogulbenkiania sp.]
MKAVIADYRYRTMCLRIVPTFGPVIRLTHYPHDMTMSNGQVYKAFQGNDFTGYTSGSGMSPAMVDLEGVADLAGISKDAVISGVYDGARCYLFATTWKTPIEDEEEIVASIFGKTTIIDDKYRIEEMSLIDALNQSVGETYGPACKKVFGSQSYAGCKVDLGPITITGTVTAISSSSVFRDAARTEVADWFAAGTIRFTTGANAGLSPIEVKRYEADGTIEIFEPFHYPVQIGDAYEMTPGCRKRLEDCRDKWNNVVNFLGFSFVPTSSAYTQVGTK